MRFLHVAEYADIRFIKLMGIKQAKQAACILECINAY
jgi:hypothetical protein